jgi:hypothetical protein
MGALPLLHHVEILIEACISILYDESILELNRGGGKKTFTWRMLFGCLLLLGSLKTLSGRERFVLNGQERVVVESIRRAGHT